jgi:hypothetical protein
MDLTYEQVQENRRAFVAALRSGEFEQGQGTLARIYRALPGTVETQIIDHDTEDASASGVKRGKPVMVQTHRPIKVTNSDVTTPDLMTDEVVVQKFCCLGVASELAFRAGAVQRFTANDLSEQLYYGRGGRDSGNLFVSDSTMPHDVQRWLGIKDQSNPDLPLGMYAGMFGTSEKTASAASMNDSYDAPFSIIADAFVAWFAENPPVMDGMDTDCGMLNCQLHALIHIPDASDVPVTDEKELAFTFEVDTDD